MCFNIVRGTLKKPTTTLAVVDKFEFECRNSATRMQVRRALPSMRKEIWEQTNEPGDPDKTASSPQPVKTMGKHVHITGGSEQAIFHSTNHGKKKTIVWSCPIISLSTRKVSGCLHRLLRICVVKGSGEFRKLFMWRNTGESNRQRHSSMWSALTLFQKETVVRFCGFVQPVVDLL